MFGLPEKQLSFLLRAGCEPTPMNLSRWNIITNPKCALCQTPQPTKNHILTRCSVALTQGIPGGTIQSCRFSFMGFKRIYQKFL